MKAVARIALGEPSIGTVSPLLHGHFAEHLGTCVYGGIWSGSCAAEPVVDALAKLEAPVLRWPGGCYADDYHWRDGIGPVEKRPRTVNIHWGNVVEDNSFGTHEFMALCQRIGAAPYFAANLGSGTVRDMRDWVEYCNYPSGSTLSDQRAANGSPDPFKVSWWGVGNENWGCGGSFCPEDYAAEYKRYADYMRNFGDTKLQLVACGPNGNDTAWTRRFFDKLGGYRKINALAAHYYTWNNDNDRKFGTATEYTEEQFYGLLVKGLGMERLIVQQRAIMDGYDPDRRIGLIVDEWGTWHKGEEGTNPAFLYQQNTVRDALVAAMTLDIFHKHADKVIMGNIAQTVNVLQAMILTDGDRMLLTPTYHVFDLYRAHKGGESLRAVFEGPDAATGLASLSGSASLHGDTLVLSLVNASATETLEVEIRPTGGGELRDLKAASLTAPGGDIRAHNTFDSPEVVTLSGYAPVADARVVTLPPASVTVVKARVS